MQYFTLTFVQELMSDGWTLLVFVNVADMTSLYPFYLLSLNTGGIFVYDTENKPTPLHLVVCMPKQIEHFYIGER